MDPVRYLGRDVLKLHDLPPLRIRHRIAEHVKEGRLEEGVELVEGLAALRPQVIRRIQDRRDSLLFGEGGEGEGEEELPSGGKERDE